MMDPTLWADTMRWWPVVGANAYITFSANLHAAVSGTGVIAWEAQAFCALTAKAA